MEHESTDSKIARIDATVKSIHEQVTKQNGNVARHELRLNLIDQKLATMEAHDEATMAYRERHEVWRKDIGDTVAEIQNELAERRGGSRGVINAVRDAALIIGLLVSIWVGYSTHLQVQAVLHQPQQQQGQR